MQTSFQWLPPFKDMPHVPLVGICPEDLYRSRIVQEAIFHPLKDQEPGPILDSEAFEKIVSKLKERAVPYNHDPLKWMRRVVGPKEIIRFLSISNPSKSISDSRILSTHTHPQTNIFLKSGTSEEQRVRDAIPRVDVAEEPLDLPSGHYMIHFDTGMAPKLVRTPRDSHFGLVKESGSIQDPLEFYTDQTGYDVVSTRLLSEVEKHFLKNKSWDVLEENIRLLEFKRVEERNGAARNFEFVDRIYDNSRLFRMRYFRSVSALIEIEKDGRMEQIEEILLQVTGRQCYSITPVSESQFLVVFEIRDIGRRAVQKMKTVYPTATITPLFRKTLTVYRNIRSAFNDAIRVRAEELIESQVPGRIVEEWKDGEEIGLLGVEGTASKFVDSEVMLLEKMLQPIVIEGTPELYFGIGEAYVRDCASRFEALVDLDKFKHKIHVFGSSAAIAVKEIEQFKKIRLEVELNLQIVQPFFNCPYVLRNTADCIGVALGASCQMEDDTFRFTGSLEAYEKLTEGLDQVSEVYMQAFRPSSPVCKICMVEAGGTEDFYRLECGHTLCRSCCNMKIKNAVENKTFKIKCGMERCERLWTPKDITRVILGDNRRIHALDGEKLNGFVMAAKRSILETEDLKPCSAPGCEGIRTRHSKINEKKCDQCRKGYCGRCLGDLHWGWSCKQAKDFSEDRSLMMFKDLNENTADKIIECPNCRMYVQKESGCQHMTCKCGAHFCFICGIRTVDASSTHSHIRLAHSTDVHRPEYRRPTHEELNWHYGIDNGWIDESDNDDDYQQFLGFFG